MNDTIATVETSAPKEFGTEVLTLSYDTHRKRWIFVCDYANRHMAKDQGFWWDKDAKEWFTTDPFMAMKLIHYADEVTRSKLAKYWNFAAGNFQESQLASGVMKEVQDSTIIPAPTGMAYKDYQRIGIEFITRTDDRCSNTLLGDDMGLGKTIQIIGAINYLSDALAGRKLGRVLIVCPASLKLNWGRELKKWLVGPLTWGIADAKYFPRNRDITVINYDVLEKWSPVIRGIRWAMIACDEAQYLKNPNAKRTKQICGHKREGIEPLPAEIKILATGTPIVNRPKELFPLVHYLDPEQFPSFVTFGIRYCNGNKVGTSWDFTGASNLEELQARLRSTVMIRRLKSEVLSELPPKTRNIIELPAPRGVTELLKKELEAFHSREPQLEAIKARVAEAKKANDTAAYAEAVALFKETSGSIMGDISTLRKEVAMKKVPLVIDYLEDLWSGDPERKIVLWCHHHDVMDAFIQHFGQFTTRGAGETKVARYAKKFSGEQSLAERDEIVQRFQNDPNCLLFVGQTLAGGVGITLTASAHVIFAELDWVPGNITQAEDRCHRIGQYDNVLVEHLVLEGSLDCRIAQRIVEKQLVIDAAMNNPTAHLQQHSMFVGAK